MRFNALDIKQGDSKNAIIDKINYNFSQIVAFSSAAKGRNGEIGPTGYVGSAGSIGATGATGNRGTIWTVSSSEPNSPQEYDVWVDQNEPFVGQVYQFISGAWEDTGVNLIESDYFDIEPDVQTIFGGTDFSAIYLAGQDQDLTSLVISDSENTSAYLNPNYSKLLISTSDQTEKPILSFRRRSDAVNSEPSFYWGQSGNSANLSLRSSYGVSFSSGGSVFLGNGSTGSLLLSGRNLNASAVQTIVLTTKNGSGSAINLSAVNQLAINSSNLNINESVFYFSQYNVAVWGSVSVTSPVGNSHPEGIVIERGGTSTSPMVSLEYSNSVNNGTIPITASARREVFTVRQTIGNTTGDTDQVIRGAAVFGGTGGLGATSNPSGPTGSWSYHVRGNLGTTTQGVGAVTIRGTSYNYVDLTATEYYLNDFITVKLSNKTWLGGSNVYLKIPSIPVLPPPSNYYPLIDQNYVSNYRILLNFGTNPAVKIYGVIWEQNYAATIFGNSTAGYITQVEVFDNPCYYIDLTYYFNPNSQEVWAFVKTCDGKSYPLLITDVNGGANGGVPS
jgi:hypothetical protein